MAEADRETGGCRWQFRVAGMRRECRAGDHRGCGQIPPVPVDKTLAEPGGELQVQEHIAKWERGSFLKHKVKC